MIESICCGDPKPLHDHKRNTIGKRIVFVLVLNKIEPATLQQAFIDMNHLNGGATEERVPDLDRSAVVASAVEKRDDFIEHIGGCHEAWQGLVNLLPVTHRCCMVLIVRELKRKQIAGIEEDRRHVWVR